jgi:hypothetical protein
VAYYYAVISMRKLQLLGTATSKSAVIQTKFQCFKGNEFRSSSL